mgnify:CR=1 FL=1
MSNEAGAAIIGKQKKESEVLAMPNDVLSETVDLSALKLGTISLGKLLDAVLCLVLCLIAMRVVTVLLRRLLKRVKWEQRLQKYLLTGVRSVLWLITVLMVIDALGVPMTSLVALLSVFTLTISLAVQTLLSNVAGGLILLSNKPFRIGDYVQTAGGSGYVRDQRLTVTVLETRDGCRITIPNSVVSAGTVTNYDTVGRRRVTTTVTASYDAPVDTVKLALAEAAARVPKLLRDPAPAAIVSSYGESSIEYQLFSWVLSEDYWSVSGALNEEIKKAFDAHGIEMTYNHLNVHILDKP